MKYVMVKFSDGDYRVYTKRVANKRTVKDWQVGMTQAMTAEVVTENTDKDALIGMAKLAREGFLSEWEDEHDLVDRTEAGDFP